MLRRLVDSIALRVILYFAVNPDEELSTSDIYTKFDADPARVYSTLSYAVREKLLVRRGGSRGRVLLECVYAPGPELLRLLGRSAAE
jgi:hypothetical protein